MHRILAILVLLAAAVTASHAQESRKIKLRTLCFEHAGDLKKVLLAGPDGKEPTVEVDLFTSTFSDEIEASLAGSELRFVVRDKDDKGREILKPVASGKAAPGERQLALFLPGAPGGLPYSLLVIDDSEAKFPMGSTLAYNLAPALVRFVIGENTKDLKPGGSDLIPQAKKVNAMNQTGVIISFTNAGGTLVPVNSTRWLSTDQQRTIAIAFIHPRTRQPTVNAYQDTPPWRLPKLGS